MEINEIESKIEAWCTWRELLDWNPYCTMLGSGLLGYTGISTGWFTMNQVIVAFGIASAKQERFLGFPSQAHCSFIGVFANVGGNSTVRWPSSSAIFVMEKAMYKLFRLVKQYSLLLAGKQSLLLVRLL